MTDTQTADAVQKWLNLRGEKPPRLTGPAYSGKA